MALCGNELTVNPPTSPKSPEQDSVAVDGTGIFFFAENVI